MRKQLMGILGTSFIIALLSLSTVSASEFGTYASDVSFEQNYEDSMSAIEKSKDLRRSLKNDRSVAGLTSNEEKWANEFDRIMADNRTDYLKKAYQIRD